LRAGRQPPEAGGHFTVTPGVLDGFAGYPDRVSDLFGILKDASPAHIMPADKVQMLLNYYEPVFKRRYDDYNKRRKDLEMFQQITERYRSLGTLLTDLALEPATESVTDITPPGTDDEKLVLSTIHSAKGLEWHTVFVIYALEGRFPASRAAMSEESMEEERRLCTWHARGRSRISSLTYPSTSTTANPDSSSPNLPVFIAGLPRICWIRGLLTKSEVAALRRLDEDSTICFVSGDTTLTKIPVILLMKFRKTLTCERYH